MKQDVVSSKTTADFVDRVDNGALIYIHAVPAYS